MKIFISFTEQIGIWSKKFSSVNQLGLSPETTIVKSQTNHQSLNTGITKIKSPVILTLAIISLTGVVGYRYINQPKLDVGTIAPEKIFAPSNGSFEDTKTTEERRRLIRTGIIPTLRRDEEITQAIYQQIQFFISEIDNLKQLIGTFPIINTNFIPLSTQVEILKLEEYQWQKIITNLTTIPENNSQLNDDYQPQIFEITQELKKYRQQVRASEFDNLLSKVTIARAGYLQATNKILSEVDKKKITYITRLLEIPDETWEQTKIGILQVSKEILTQGIPPGMPSNLLEETIKINIEPEIPEATAPLVTNLLKDIFIINRPNLTEDKEETKRKAEQAAEGITPVILYINKGDLIVDRGQVITQTDFVFLDGFGLSKRTINWQGFALSGLVVITTVGIFSLVLRKIHRPMRCRDHFVLYLLSLSVPLLAVFDVPYTSLPAVALLVSSFYSPKLAVSQTILLTGLMGFTVDTVQWQYLLGGATAGTVAAIMAGRLHSREELAMLGGAIALTQAGVYLTVNLVISAAAGTIWNVLLPEAAIYGASGLAWIIVALGISPYLERLFDLATPIRLAELSNPNRPLLKRLATEAPGTFQHTLFVSSLAEAAARELHCNVELVRAGTLYHDIGKMHDPLGFIENQMGGPNKHDEINDPWISAEIIKKHVSEGLVMARKYNLPKVIRDFIPEHQGKLLIAYFYFQAKQILEKEDGEVDEADFRYDGPIPQSRETALVMLADACEAALRSLNKTTLEKALVMVQKILKARWNDNQLVDSGIREDELPTIAKIFVQVWQQHNHQRIAYPKAALEPK